MNTEIADIQRIFTEKSKPVGKLSAFTVNPYPQTRPHPLQKSIAWSDLAEACTITTTAGINFQNAPAPIANGFSLQLHGLREGEAITTLCFESTQAPAFPPETAERMIALLEKNNLLLVH